MKNYGKYAVLLLRVATGWHFLYEGLVKLFNPEWSAYAFLKGSYGFLSGFYHWLASDPALMNVLDFLNVWGLVLIGSGLFLGVFTRIASIAGIILLFMYYFAYPPFGESLYGSPEGHYWIVNRNLLEIFVLGLILWFPVREFSLEALFRFKSLKGKEPEFAEGRELQEGRRQVLRSLVTLPFFGGVVYAAAAKGMSSDPDALSGATIALKKFDLSDLKGELPKGKLAGIEMSRVVLGCNLIGGWAHARDLNYVGTLFRHYNTEKKIMETLSLCEQAGINCTNMVTKFLPLFNKYRNVTGSRMTTINQVHVRPEEADPLLDLKEARDLGTTSMYIQGGTADKLLKEGKLEEIIKAVEWIRSQGLPAGVGAHSIKVVEACEAAGFKPDYYFKTMHHDRYWSAHPREFREEFSVDTERFLDHNKFHDNIFDLFPEKTAEVFERVDVPLFGFKVLAAGAIDPADGFRYAFEKGSDFICVGMFDFQVVENVNTAIDVLNGPLNRKRPWYS